MKSEERQREGTKYPRNQGEKEEGGHVKAQTSEEGRLMN